MRWFADRKDKYSIQGYGYWQLTTRCVADAHIHQDDHLGYKICTTGRSNHLDELADRWLLLKCDFAGAYIVHGAHHPDLTFVEHLTQHNAPVAKLLHGQLDIHFRNRLDELRVL